MPDRIEIIEGNITKQKVDAIVNAANSALLGGGGVDGAIHRAAGPKLLAGCYRNSLALAEKNSIKTIAFPSISTGAYRFPVERAAVIAVSEIKNFFDKNTSIEKVYIVCFDKKTFQAYSTALAGSSKN